MSEIQEEGGGEASLGWGAAEFTVDREDLQQQQCT